MRKSRMLALLLSFFMILLTACSGESPKPEPTQTSYRPLITPTPTPAPTPEPSAAPESSPEPGDGGGEVTPRPVTYSTIDWDASYADQIDISGAEFLSIADCADSRPMTAEEAGWSPLGQSAKTVPGKIIGVDDYNGKWIMAVEGEKGMPDTIALFEAYKMKTIFECDPAFPNIGSVCHNPAGIQWIEYNNSYWRLRQLRNGSTEPEVLLEDYIYENAMPVVVSREHYMMPLYGLQDGKACIRAWNSEAQEWYEQTEYIYTTQKQPPQSVESWVTWIEQTSKGWAAVCRNFETGEKRVFVVSDIAKPTLATFDGQLLMVLSHTALFACDVQTREMIYVSGMVTNYQHIPRDGAIVSAMANEQQAVRFQYYPNNGLGQYAILPLAAIRDKGIIRSVFHHSYEIDVEMLLVERSGGFEQTTVSLRRAG